MIKNLTRHGNSYALIIDRAILELLKLGPESPLQLSTDGTALIVQRAPGTHDRPRAEKGPKRPTRRADAKVKKPGKGPPHHTRRPITLAHLRKRRREILALAVRHGAANVRVIGSVARGDARPDSDVDLLVEFAPERTLLDQISLIQALGDLLRRPVDIVSERGLNARIRDRVLEEAVAL
ncbi:MAG: nucleotidyltransferase family protein [Planctomycetota bacterium]|jgi:predicted nucleotidyltransferase/antitoxin component of MazEF toxin-antitoxin module